MVEEDWLEKARRLRAEAWEAVQGSHSFVAFRKFDDLVVEMGGTSSLPAVDLASNWRGAAQRAVDAAAKRVLDQKKMSQGDAAELALRQEGEPLPIGRLLEKVTNLGVVVSGADPLANFRSTMSKDNRFGTLRRNNMFFWWMPSEPLPERWTSGAEERPVAMEAEGSSGGADDG